MKTKPIAIVWLNVLIFAACAPSATTPSQANNIALVFQYTPCGSTPMYILDTASSTLVYTPLGDTTSTTIPLHLTDDELESIYQKALSIDFFDYPSKFVVPNDQALGFREPAGRYEISLTNGKVTNSVLWTNEIITKPSYTKVDQLQELMKLIYETIQSHPEVKQLPRGALCL